MTQFNETALIAAARAGKDAAFCELALHYRDRLMRFLIVRGVTRADAEDATQDALVNAWRYLSSYDSRWSFSTWLYRIALRELPKRRMTDVPLTGDEPAKTAPENAIDLDNIWRLASEHLSRDAATALWLKYAEELTIKDIAHTMQRSQPWVKVSLMRSRQTLRAQVMRTMT